MKHWIISFSQKHLLNVIMITLLDPKDFSCGSAGKESACNAGDLGSIPLLGRSAGEGIGYQLQYLAWRIPWTVNPWGHKESDTIEQLSLDPKLLSMNTKVSKP